MASFANTLNKAIRIQRRAVGDNAYGEASQTWVDVASGVYAAINDVSGREYLASGENQNKVETTIRIRYPVAFQVTKGMRANWNGAIYNIEAALDPDGQRRFLSLMCSTGVNNG